MTRKEKLINRITEKIKKQYKPKKIILFGSYAYGKPTKDSDIDLLIIKNTAADSDSRWLTVRKLVREEIRKTSIMPLVYTEREIINKVKMGDDFIKEVLTKGKVLYG